MSIREWIKQCTEVEPEAMAQRILQYYGNDRMFPIGTLACSLGFRVFKKTLRQTLSGYIACDDNIDYPRQIVVNEMDNYGHQRFTIAHELWHYIKRINSIDEIASTTGLYSPYDTDPCVDDPEEKEANDFAAELLMPHDIFSCAYKGGKYLGIPEDELNERLEDRFGVSETAIKRRTQTLQCR